MSDTIKNLDEIVRNYLLTRGFSKAAAELEIESQNTNKERGGLLAETAQKTLSRKIFSSISEDIVMLGASGGNVAFYFFEYETLHSWTKTSLDIVQPELLQITFPIFVHCYIGLVRHGALEEARLFWKKWEPEHRGEFPEEMKELSMLTSPQQIVCEDFISSNLFIRHALQKKFRIVMSTFAYGILTTFLIHNNLLLLAAMVNDKIHIEKVQDWPGSQSLMFEFDADSSEVGIVGLVGGAGRGPLAPVRLWAPSKGMSSLETKDDPLYREWISKLAHPRAKLADWASKRATDIHFRDDSTGGEATAKRVKMSSEATRLAALDKAKILEPNVIFATITNTHDDMSCLHINRTMTQAAAGFKDSCVRVWKLNENDNKGFGTSLSTGSGNNVSGAGGSSWAMREVLPITKGAGPVLLPAGASDASSLMRPMLELRGHRKPVYAVSQDDSGRIVLSGSADNTVRLWDTSVAQCVGKFECMSPVWGVSLSPLRYYFAAACHDSTALVFSTDRVAPIRLLAGHRSDVTAVTWHESGSLLGTCSDDKQVRLWDMRAGKCVRLFEGSHAPLCSIALTSFALGNTASSMIAAGSDTGMVHLWDVGTSRKLAVCQGHEGPVHTVSFSKDGGALISGGADCSMKIFDTSMAFAPALRAVIASDYTSSSVLNREATPIIKPHKTFHTKFSPVYFADATPYGMVYSGGPFSLPSALESRKATTANGEQVATAASETDTAAALGLSHTVLLTT